VQGIFLAKVRSNPFAEDEGNGATRELHPGDDGGDVLGELTVDDIDIMLPDEPAEFPDNPRMEVAAHIKRDDGDAVRACFLFETTARAAGKPQTMVALLKLTSHLQGLNLKSSPGSGEARLEYVESAMGRHVK
jgi:hypothetical protein